MPTSLYYTSCLTIAPNCQLFTNSALTIPVSAGYYSDSVNCFTVTGSSGIVATVAPCPTTSTTSTSTTATPVTPCQFVRFINTNDNPLSAPANGQYQKCVGQPGFFTVPIPYGQISDPFCIKGGTASVINGSAVVQILSSTCPIAPATSTLTFTEYKQGKFKFTLSTAILGNIVITDAEVTGYDGTCTVVQDSDTIDSTNALTILAQSTTASVSGNSPISVFTSKYRRTNNITINGVSKADGQTITIAGTVVTINISTTCINYIP
jgi:hypothetical protein